MAKACASRVESNSFPSLIYIVVVLLCSRKRKKQLEHLIAVLLNLISFDYYQAADFYSLMQNL